MRAQDGDTALHWAASGGHAEVVATLLSKGADGRVANAVGATPLHLASQNGHAPVVALLLRDGKQPVDVRDRAGRTALMFAAQYGKVEVLALLIEAGASSAARSNVRALARIRVWRVRVCRAMPCAQVAHLFLCISPRFADWHHRL